MAYKNNNTFLGPWEAYRKIALAFALVLSLGLIIFVNIPSGLSAILFMIMLAKIWKPIGVTDPTLGSYIPDTKPFNTAKFFMAYDRRKSQVLAPMTSLGLGPPSPDSDHEIETPGWFPPTRLSALWCAVGALPLILLDYYAQPIFYPFWDGETTMPIIVQLVISYLAWYALLQSIFAVRRIQGDRTRIIAIEPAPATMLHKVKGDDRITSVLGKSLGIGIVLAFLVFVIWQLSGWEPVLGWTMVGVALSITFLIAISRIFQKNYQAKWRERNIRRKFWEETLDFLKDNNPTLVSERELPTYEQWLEMPHSEDEPYAPNISVATFMFAPNANFNDYVGKEERINGALGASLSSISPIEDMDEFTGESIKGTVSNQGFRIWWTQERLDINDLLDPNIDPWMREFGVRSIIIPKLADIRAIGTCILHSYSMVTKPASDIQIIQVKVVPPAGITLSQFLSKIDMIENQLSVDWVRAYQSFGMQSKNSEDEARQVITLLIGQDPSAGRVKYSGSPSIMRKIVENAEWSYVFNVNGVVGPRGAPRLIRDRAATSVVNEKTFTLPDGLNFKAVKGSLEGLRDSSRNNFMEITPGAANVSSNSAKNVRDRDKIEKEQGTKFTVITSKEDPLARIFEFGDYKEKMGLVREPGIDKIEWNPGILTNDEMAKDSFDSEEPSLLPAGSSGSGKSVVLQNMVLQLALKNSPEELQFWMIEPKIGLQRFKGLDNTTNFVDSWTPTENFYQNCAEFFRDLVEEMKRRNRIFKDHPEIPEKLFQARRIAKREGDLPDGSPHPMMVPHIIAVIEECATVYTGALDKEDQEYQKEILGYALRIAREGRSAGIYLTNTTQYPTNASIPMQMRQQSRRIGLKTKDAFSSRVVIDENGLEEMTVKGSGLINQGYGFRKFRGLWLRDGDVSKGEPNDIIDNLKLLPKNSKMESGVNEETGYIEVPDPESAVFRHWNEKSGAKLDKIISSGKNTKDPSNLV